MAKKSFASHLREKQDLRNNRAKKINGDNLGEKRWRAPEKIQDFNSLADRRADEGEVPLKCQTCRPISAQRGHRDGRPF